MDSRGFVSNDGQAVSGDDCQRMHAFVGAVESNQNNRDIQEQKNSFKFPQVNFYLFFCLRTENNWLLGVTVWMVQLHATRPRFHRFAVLFLFRDQRF